MPIFCPENVYALKNTVLTCNFFFKFVMKNPLLSCTYLVKKRRFCQNYTILWAKRVNRIPFFSDFSWKNLHEKITALLSIFCQKNLFSLKNTLFSCPYFMKKTSILSKTRCSHVIIFKFFMKNPILSVPYLFKKTSILS